MTKIKIFIENREDGSSPLNGREILWPYGFMPAKGDTINLQGFLLDLSQEDIGRLSDPLYYLDAHFAHDGISWNLTDDANLLQD